MSREFGVGDLGVLTNRLRRAGEDLDDAAARIARMAVGRHGVLNPATAHAIHVLWAGWSALLARQAARCTSLAAAVAWASRDYRATDHGVAGHPDPAEPLAWAPAWPQGAVAASLDLAEGPLMADPGEALAGMVAGCGHLSIEIDTIAHAIAVSPTVVDWWGTAADAAFTAIRDLGRDVQDSASALDALRDVVAVYGERIWSPSGRSPSTDGPVFGVDPGRDLAEQAHEADTELRAGLVAWAAPRHAETVAADEPAYRSPATVMASMAILTSATPDPDEPQHGRTGSPMIAGRRPVVDVYRVAAGDTLWAIARRTLGDARRWRDIFDLNDGRRQRDGRTLTDPRLILPGWRLQLPPGGKRPGATTIPRVGQPHAHTPAPTSAAPRPSPATTPTHEPPALAASPSPAARGAFERHSGWPTVDIALGAAGVGAGVGWIAGRRRSTAGAATPDASPAMSTVAAEQRTASTATVAPAPSRHELPPRASDVHLAAPSTAATTAVAAAASPAGRPPLLPPADEHLRLAVEHSHEPAYRHASEDAISRWPDHWIPAGTGFVGPGATGAARSRLIHALHTGLSGAVPTGAVITTTATMTMLVPDVPESAHTIAGLTIARDLTDALNHLDQEILTRSRLTDTMDAAVTADDSDDLSRSWRPVLIITEAPPPADRVRLAAILLQGAALGIDAIILGPWPTGTTITIDHNGQHNSAGPSESRPDSRTTSVIDVDTALTVLRSLASAQPQQVNERPPTGSPDVASAAATYGQPPSQAPDTDDTDTGDTDSDPPTTPPADASDETASNAYDNDSPASSQPAADAHVLATHRRVNARVLGTTPQLTNPPSDTAVAAPPWRPQARELLAYLMCHPRGVTEHVLFEDVLGDVPGSKVRSRLNTYVYNLHQQLRAAGGPGTYITHTPRGHIMIDPDRVDSDLWRLQQHLDDAAAASDLDVRIGALQAAVAAYTGPLAGDEDYYWIPPIREATRRTVIDAHVALADLLAPSDAAAAVTVIEHAIGHDPHNETLYQHGMRLHAAQRALAAVAALRNRLVRELADIGTSPTPQTLRLADDLLADLPTRLAPNRTSRRAT